MHLLQNHGLKPWAPQTLNPGLKPWAYYKKGLWITPDTPKTILSRNFAYKLQDPMELPAKGDKIGFLRAERLFIVRGFNFSVDEWNLQRRNIKPFMA